MSDFSDSDLIQITYGGDARGKQVVEVLAVLRRQAADQNAPSGRHGAGHGLDVQRSGPSTWQTS